MNCWEFPPVKNVVCLFDFIPSCTASASPVSADRSRWGSAGRGTGWAETGDLNPLFFWLFCQPVSMVQTVYGWVNPPRPLAWCSKVKLWFQVRAPRSPVWIWVSAQLPFLWGVQETQRALSPGKTNSVAAERFLFRSGQQDWGTWSLW